MIKEIEDALIKKLKANITDIHVESFAEKSREYNMNVHKGVILVRYERSDYSKSQTTDLIVQDRTVKFGMSLIIRNLQAKNKAHKNCYDYVDDIIRILTGFRTLYTDKFYCVQDGFVEEDNGQWIYAFIFEAKAQNIEQIEEETPVYANSITFKSNSEILEIPEDPIFFNDNFYNWIPFTAFESTFLEDFTEGW